MGELTATGLFAALALAMEFVPPLDPPLSRGLPGDNAARGAMALTDPRDQRTVRAVSDSLLMLISAYPYLVDGLVLAAWHRRSPDVARQIVLINLLTMSVTVGVTSVVKEAVSRERPYGETCGKGRPDTLYDCEHHRRYRSFFSGHSSLAFASAGLICMHHLNLGLHGNRAADAGTCAAAYGVAAVTGTLRIVADQHYFTDVLFGAAFGTLTGLALPWLLHYRHGEAGASSGGGGAVDAHLVPTTNGVALAGTFDETGGRRSAARPDTLGLNDGHQDPWRNGRVRPFLSTRLDLGFLYFKPRVSLGYGKPHAAWVGVDLNAMGNMDHVGVWGGLRGALGWIDLRVGARYLFSWNHTFLEPLAVYTQDDVDNRVGPDASFVSLEAELTLTIPAGPGELLGEVAGTHVLGVAEGYHVYEESLKVVVDPPWVWRARLGYRYRLDRRGIFRLGLVGEVAGVPNREARTVRGGVIGSARLLRNLELRVSFMPVLYSDDDLGAAGSDLLMLGVRHRWATGM